MANNKIIYGSEVLMDLTQDTVEPSTLAEGVTAHDRHGEKITGSMLSGSNDYEDLLNHPRIESHELTMMSRG